MKKALILIGLVLTIWSSVVSAEQEVSTKDQQSDLNERIIFDPRPGVGLFSGHYHAFNPANKEEFDFPYYGAILALRAGENLRVGVRWMSSSQIIQLSSEGNTFHHYFRGLGVEGRYAFWDIFYLKLNCDLVQYNIKIGKQAYYWEDYAKSGNGLVGSLGFGLNYLFSDHLYCYAGVYTSSGRVATESGPGTTDEIFDFTSPENYEFGLLYYF